MRREVNIVKQVGQIRKRIVRIWAIRHGEKGPDGNLTPLGEQQVRDAYAKHLIDVRLSKVVTGVPGRVQTTGEIIAQLDDQGLKIVVDRRVSGGYLYPELVATDDEYRTAYPDCDSRSKGWLGATYPVLYQAGGVCLQAMFEHVMDVGFSNPETFDYDMVFAGHTNIFEFAYLLKRVSDYNSLPFAGMALFTFEIEQSSPRLVSTQPLDQDTITETLLGYGKFT